MTNETQGTESSLPATLGDAIASVPAALVPRSIRAIDRLIGAAVDVPVAWLNQQKAKIDAQTAAHQAVEKAIGQAVANEASLDPEIVAQATAALVRKAYRKQENLTAAAAEAVDQLGSNTTTDIDNDTSRSVDDDWLNVFERFAEDASTDRMQKLWGRVLAGEIRKPGKYSVRTLRFLSEFSQKEAEIFERISQNFLEFVGPKKLVNPDDLKDIRELLILEESGIIQGASGLGLSFSMTFSPAGFAVIKEGPIAIGLKGVPGNTISFEAITLTRLGIELLSLIPSRPYIDVARRVAFSVKSSEIESAYLLPNRNGFVPFEPIETLWEKVDNL